MQMQPTDWSPTRQGQRVLALGLAILLVGSVFASVAAADAAIGLRKAEVSATTVTVGENVTVTAEAVNVGDSGGGFTFDFRRNGTQYGTTWTTFESVRESGIRPNERRAANATLQFDRPGTYKLRVNDRTAGVVTVTSARTQIASENETQRRIDVKASGVSESEATEFDIPSSNRSVALARWSTTTGQSAFQQYLTEYTNRSEMPGPVPDRADSTLLGAVDFESDDGFEEATMEIAVDDAVLANSTLDRDEVTVYQRNGETWEPLSTSVATEDDNRTVYEATATRGTTYAVGRISPDVSIAGTSYGSTVQGTSARLSVDARLQNTAPVAGTYRGAMRVNGETVNVTTVTVPASGETNLSLSHAVTEPGQYRLAVNETDVGSVFIPEGQLSGSQSTGSSPDSATDTAPGVASEVDDTLPTTVLGIDTLYLVGGLAIALGVFVVILLLLRQGGDSGGGGSGGSGGDDFDPW